MSRFTPNVSSRPRVLTAALTALSVLAAAGTLLPPGIAAAGEPVADGMQTNVYYTQRDLATEQGTRSLYRRIERAAADVCPVGTSLFPSALAVSKECQRKAIARAIGEIGSPRLAALDAQSVGRRG